ncbi:hypothetical protein [Leptospira yanagawae]|uniref:hypothetical protein n=1 Tax=Leptospira yanagawae TaxID=293069 RepID=UPI0005866756|nr:hypothetical protein [Leptospira yanagawae]
MVFASGLQEQSTEQDLPNFRLNTQAPSKSKEIRILSIPIYSDNKNSQVNEDIPSNAKNTGARQQNPRKPILKIPNYLIKAKSLFSKVIIPIFHLLNFYLILND